MPGSAIEGDLDVRSAQLERRTRLSVVTAGRARLLGVAVSISGLLVLVCGLLSEAPAGDGRLICTSLLTAPCTAGGSCLFPGWYSALATLGALLILGSGATSRFGGSLVSWLRPGPGSDRPTRRSGGTRARWCARSRSQRC